LTAPEAADLELDAASYAPLEQGAPLAKGAVVAARAVLCGPGLSGVLSLERDVGPSDDAAGASDPWLACVLAGSLSSGLVAHRSYRHRVAQQTLADTAFRQSEALLCVLDRSACVSLFNHALERLTGYDEADVMGAPFGQWLCQGGDERLTRLILETLNGRPARGFEASLPLKTGGCATALITAAPVYDDDHAICGVTLVGLDQHHLAEFSDRQEDRLARLRRVAAGVALQLMAPASQLELQVSALRGLTSGVAEAGAPLDALARVGRSLKRLAGGLGELSGPRDELVATASVNQVVEAALKRSAERISEQGLRVRTALAGELPDILGLPGRLERAVTNLLNNACQAGSKRITVRTWDNRDGTIGISVADSGEGIAEEHLAHVLQPFYTARPDGHAIGLGLAVVQDAVDVHDGTVDIDSGEGEGTVVTITLPVRRPTRASDDRLSLETPDEA
jgi:PAS domain S-box-containing protein